MKHIVFARKKRQLKNLATTLQVELKKERGSISEHAHQLIRKIKQILSEIRFGAGRYEVVKILGAVAILFGLSGLQETKAQIFDTAVASPFNLTPVDSASFPAFADIDSDGDMDLFAGEYYGVIRYFENVGTTLIPDFGPAQTGPFGLTVPASSLAIIAKPTFADLDGDGDIDALLGTAGYNGSELLYFENTGTPIAPAFASPQVNPFGLTTSGIVAFPEFADMDGDGDFDLFVGTSDYYDGSFEYYENTGTASAPAFAAPQNNPFGLGNTYIFALPTIADLDGDGDKDVMAGDYSGGFNYFENTGTVATPAFGSMQFNPFGLNTLTDQCAPAFADIDADGDIDLFAGEYGIDILFFQNRAFTIGLDDSKQVSFELFPNPTADLIKIDGIEESVSYEILDATGQRVQEGTYEQAPINVQALPPGQYVLRLRDEEGVPLTKNFGKQ
jgi:hypothetical protein